jgi:hypothetical protein
MHVLNVTCYALGPCWCSIYRQLQPPAASRHSFNPVSTLIPSKSSVFSASSLILQGEGKLHYSCTGHDTSFYFGTVAVLHFSLTIYTFYSLFLTVFPITFESCTRHAHSLTVGLFLLLLLLLTAAERRFEVCRWRRQTSKRVTLIGRYKASKGCPNFQWIRWL